MKQRIAIAAPDIHAGDAVGNHCLYLAQDLDAAGYATTLYAQRATPLAQQVLPLEQLLERPWGTDPGHELGHDLLLVSYSILDPYLERLLALPLPKLAYFHGVTPAALLREHEPVTADLCERSLAQLPLLARFDRLAVNSEFNRRDLAAYLDSSGAAVIPPISARLPLFQQAPLDADRAPSMRILMLGRIVPHKRIENGIEMLARLRRQGLAAELDVVGSCHNAVYAEFLRAQAQALGVADAVHFLGMLSDQEVAQRFAQAGVLLVASEHEGFCVPVLEAMHLGVPALVRQGTAAQEVGAQAVAAYATLEQGASLLEGLLQESKKRGAMVKSGQLRASELLRQACVDAWKDVLPGSP